MDLNGSTHTTLNLEMDDMASSDEEQVLLEMGLKSKHVQE